jgi:hypothetical protein
MRSTSLLLLTAFYLNAQGQITSVNLVSLLAQVGTLETQSAQHLQHIVAVVEFDKNATVRDGFTSHFRK